MTNIGLLPVFVLATFANRAYEMIWVLYTSYRFHWETAQIGLSLGIAGGRRWPRGAGRASLRLWAVLAFLVPLIRASCPLTRN